MDRGLKIILTIKLFNNFCLNLIEYFDKQNKYNFNIY